MDNLQEEVGIRLAPIAAHNAPQLPRYRRSQLLIEQARQGMQAALASQEQAWLRAHGPGAEGRPVAMPVLLQLAA